MCEDNTKSPAPDAFTFLFCDFSHSRLEGSHFTGTAVPPLNWRVLPLNERPIAHTGWPAARYGAAYFFRWICDIATFGGLFTP